MDLKSILKLKESEDKVEFKAAKNNFKYAGGDKVAPKDRRHCVLGYVVAFCNEGGGKLILGVSDSSPHKVVGTNFYEGSEGSLEDKIYNDLAIRVRTHVLFDNEKRVLIIEIPGRSTGQVMKFEGVGLMRIGESLREMSDEEMLKTLSEREPDFSAKFCEGLTIDDLNNEALIIMKRDYSNKQNNPAFQNLTTEQILSDLKLLDNDKLNYAALILLGKKEIIEKYLPQSKIVWEFRFSEPQVHYDFREIIAEPLFLGINKIWNVINDKNADIPIQDGAYISSSKSFNEGVMREAILNAIAHRDYTITSEVVIKQYPKKIIINNPGGFPRGVTIDNILTISSTPRSRLMTEVLEKTGLVERSGQGVDKIYLFTLSEGKAEPNYRDSDSFQVTLKLDGTIQDKAFNIFISQVQAERGPDKKLSVEEIVTLYKVKLGLFMEAKPEILVRLEKEDLLKKGSGHTKRYTLPDAYQQMSSKEQRIGSRYTVIEIEHFLLAIQGKSLRIGDLEIGLSGSLNRNQIKYLISKLYEDSIITSEGKGRGTKYMLKEPYNQYKGEELLIKCLDYLRAKYEKE